ncbi:hypothetical protein FHG87_010474 [Trinorchestia longiramus]|nr:hypothetical protein FHG87_010474 [Trinorchestia longiramus]
MHPVQHTHFTFPRSQSQPKTGKFIQKRYFRPQLPTTSHVRTSIAQGRRKIYVTRILGSVIYVTRTLGSTIYVTRTLGSKIYVTRILGSKIYVTRILGSTIYESRSLGSTIYVTRTPGSAIYVTRILGSTIYVTRTLGSTIYLTRTLGSIIYVARILGSTIYVTRTLGSTIYVSRTLGSTIYVTRTLGSTIYIFKNRDLVFDQTTMMQQVLSVLCLALALGTIAHGNNGGETSSSNTRLQILKVERSNPYCTFQRLFGPVCNMTGFDGILSIEPDPMLTNALEVAVIGANTILLYPTCVPWVKFYNAQDFLTSQHKSPGAGEDNENCRTWLRATDSKISALRSGIHDISLMNSTVQMINLHDLRDVKVAKSNISVIEHLDWKGYKGELSTSEIGFVLHVECNDNLTTFDTHIGQIGFQGFSFNAKKLILNYTTIDEVYPQGILLNSGIIIIENTILRKVSRDGIILGSEAVLLMNNVTIEECEKPCITTSFRLGSRYFMAASVTVNGEYIENSPDVIKVTLDEIVENPDSLENDAHCRTSAEILLCDFSDFDERVVLTPTENSKVTQVNISNAANLHIVEACGMDIVVLNTVGVYTQAIRGSKRCNGTGGTLTTINSTFNVVHVKDLKNLKVFQSKINNIDADTVDELVSRNSELKIKQITVSKETNLTSSEVDIVNATFDGTLYANLTTFKRVSSLHIAGNASIMNNEFGHLGIHSITVSGYLLLSHVTIKSYEFLPIYLTESGVIELTQVTLNGPWHFISAVRHDQVKWESISPEERKHLVALRIPEDKTGIIAIADQGQRDCTVMQPLLPFPRVYDIFCDYSGVEDVETVSVNLIPSIITRSMIIKGAKNVRMKDICTHEITLIDVGNATMDYLMYHCFYRLRIQNSHVMSIANEPNELKIDNSTVREIETPFPMGNLGIYNSSIDSLIVAPVTTRIEQSHITSIKMLMSRQHCVVNHSTIDTIESMQVFGSGALINVDIGRINSPGILIDGHLLIENATINYLDSRSITFISEGSLKMVNVDIVQGWINSFNLSKGSMSITNVTMLGTPLHNNVEVDGPPTKAPTNVITDPAPDRTTKSPAIIKTTLSPDKPKEHSTADGDKLTAAPQSKTNSELSKVNQQTQPWVKWATAGASIFLALVAVLIALSLVVVVRTHRSGETFSSRLGRMFRAANDDELQLSTELDIHLASDRDSSTTHYSRLPSI